MMQNTPSMVKNWPDAINCGYKRGSILFLEEARDAYMQYWFIFHLRGIYMQFNLDGTYRTRSDNDDDNTRGF